MGDMGVHLIDMIRWNFGEFARVTAQAGVAYPARSAPGGKPTDAEVRAALDGNLCRCGAHNRIVRAVLRAAKEA